MYIFLKFQRCLLVEMLYLVLLILSHSYASGNQGEADHTTGTSSIPGDAIKIKTVEICNSTSCKRMTSKLLFLINHNAYPCEEFPEFVCGNQDLLQDSFSNETFESFEKFLRSNVNDKSDKYRKDFRDFYQSCLHFQTDFALSDILKLSWNRTYDNLTEILIETVLQQSFPFFDIGLDIDEETGKYIFQMTLPGDSVLKTNTDGWSSIEQIKNQCGDDLQDSLDDETNLNEMYAAFTECEQDILRKLLTNHEENVRLILKVNDTEATLRELLLGHRQVLNLPKEELRQAKIEKRFKLMSIDDLKIEFGIINWKQFFEGITTNETFSGNEIIQVYLPDYLKTIFDFFKTIEERKLIGMLHGFSQLELYKNLLQPYENNKKILCMSLAQQLMPDVASIIFYEKKFSNDAVLAGKQSKDLFDKLKKRLKESIGQSSLDEASKLAFENKLVRLKIGLITSGNSNSIDDDYRNLNIGTDFVENLISVMRNYRKIIFSHVGKTATAASLLNYFVSPFHDKPKTFYSSDTIVLHPGIFDRVPSNLPEYIRIAKLGLLLSQEMLKHFDPTGLLFKADNTTIIDEKYKMLVDRTKELLDTVYLKNSINFHQKSLSYQNISQEYLLNELVSDNAAFKLVTDYYETLGEQTQMPWIHNDFTVQQVFLIAAAQEFCERYSETDLMRDLFERGRLPYLIRIQNMVSNSAFFSENFMCPDGSTMTLPQEMTIQFPNFPEADSTYDNYDPQY